MLVMLSGTIPSRARVGGAGRQAVGCTTGKLCRRVRAGRTPGMWEPSKRVPSLKRGGIVPVTRIG